MLRKREEFLMDVVEELTWSEKRQGIKREEEEREIICGGNNKSDAFVCNQN